MSSEHGFSSCRKHRAGCISAIVKSLERYPTSRASHKQQQQDQDQDQPCNVRGTAQLTRIINLFLCCTRASMRNNYYRILEALRVMRQIDTSCVFTLSCTSHGTWTKWETRSSNVCPAFALTYPCASLECGRDLFSLLPLVSIQPGQRTMSQTLDRHWRLTLSSFTSATD